MKPIRIGIALMSTMFIFFAVGRPPVPAANPPDANAADRQTAALEQIAAQEYEVTWQGSTGIAGLSGAWQAPNRVHDFRTYFTAAGIRVVPRTGEAPSWEWGLTPVGLGRHGSASALPAAVPAPRGNRVEYEHGRITEWYVNDPAGLEQGFMLAGPPEDTTKEAAGAVASPGGPATHLMHLDLALTGSLRPVLSNDRQAIDFEAPGGARVIHYADLKVTDARGASLKSRMEVFAGPGAGGIRILVDDSNAVYPVTIDSLATSPSWSAEGDQLDAVFASAVASAGDVNGDGFSDLIIGAKWYDNGQTDEGRVFVYLGTASGPASSPSWMADGDQAYGYFGCSVAAAGDVNGDGYSDVIIGAYGFDTTGIDAGRAVLYLGSPAGLGSSPAWTVEGDQGGANFGISVATSGDVNGDGYSDVIVGADGYDNGQTNEGRAFLYLGSAAGLAPTAAWTAESDQANSSFGAAVGTAGDVDGDGYADVVIGAWRFANGQSSEGKVFLYEGSPAGLALSPSWSVEGEQAAAYLGWSVATAGDVNGDGFSDVIIGSHGYDNGQMEEGRALCYLGSPSGLSVAAAWTVEGDQPGASLGVAVASAGDVNGDGFSDVIVGARGYSNGETAEGRAGVYFGSALGLSPAPAWEFEGNQANAHFGSAVAPAGDVNGDGYSDVVVGAPYYDNGQTDEGRAFLFAGAASGPATSPGWIVDSDETYAYFPSSVAAAGDVNGDGYADLIVGANQYRGGETVAGRAWVYPGSATGLAPVASWTATGRRGFGVSVATAGDVNGDGFSDVVVGADDSGSGGALAGSARVYLGSASGLATSPAWSVDGDQAGARLGDSLAAAGDVNGDGYADVIIGAYMYDGSYQDAGAAWVYLGSASGLSATPAWTALGGRVNDYFGQSVAAAGDVNGDGYSDVIVGANSYDNGSINEGAAYLYLGSASGLAALPAWVAEGDADYALLGSPVAPAGDVNGDGFSDVLVRGIFWDASSQTEHGRVLLFLGSAAGLAATPAWTAEGDQVGAYFGEFLGSAGDVNGDGYSDVIVGAPSYNNGQENEGRAFVYLGSAAGLSAAAALTIESNQADALLGQPVATAGDVNGDGYSDVVVAAPGYSNGQPGEGRVFVHYGNGGPGVSLRPQQRRSDHAAPIAPLGISDRRDGFRLAMLGRTPAGRGKVRLAYEVEPLGSPLDGDAVQRETGWSDSGVEGAGLGALVQGLTTDTPYHWRARLEYPAADSPFQAHGRWITGWWNGAQEADLRTRWETDFSIAQRDDPDPQFGGQTIVYHIVATNNGPGTASAVLADTLPAGAVFLGAMPSQGTCDIASFVVTCALGPIGDGSTADVFVRILAPPGWTTATNLASVSIVPPAVDPESANNIATESTLVVAADVGDFVWNDQDADGLQDPGEVGVPNVLVALCDGAGAVLSSTWTDHDGHYTFADRTYGASYRLRFSLPAGYLFTARDRGEDEGADSDADPATGESVVFALTEIPDLTRWDAGLVPDRDRDGHTPPGGDCNDADASVHPGAVEACNGQDDDCDGLVDETCDAVCDQPAMAGAEIDLDPAAANAGSPKLAWTGVRYGMVFTDVRDGNNEVYFTLLDDSLNRDGSDVRVTSDPGNSTAPQAAFNGTDFGIVWQDDRDGNPEIYFARLDADGHKLTGDVRVTNAEAPSRTPRIAWSGTDFGVLWNDQRDGTNESWFVRLDADGTLLGPERRITPTPYDSNPARFEWNGAEYGVVYNDNREGDWEIYFQALDRYGNATGSEVRLTDAAGVSRLPMIAWDGVASQFGVVWADTRSGSEELYFTRVAADGTKLTGDHPLTGIVNASTAIAGLVHSGGEFALSWIDQSVAGGEVYFARLAQDAFSGAPVRVTNDPASDQGPSILWNGGEYVVSFADNRAGTTSYHPYAARIGCCRESTLGDRVWTDADLDGIQDGGEIGAADLVVGLYDGAGALLQATETTSGGWYGFTGLACGSTYSLAFFPPPGKALSPPHRGSDDALDSDADPVTGRTGPFVLSSALDAARWDAGIMACWPPDEPIFIANVHLSTDGHNHPILDYQDPNQQEQVTGYNVYRSSVASLPPAEWPLVATDVIDMDEATPNKQWVDRSGDVSPTGAWYYQVTAYNHRCPLEGPR